MSSELKSRIPDPEVLLALEPEELAGVLLSILQERSSPGQRISLFNFVNSLRQFQEIYPRQYVPAISRAIMEAFGWMQSNLLLATDPEESSLVFLTRQGQSIRTREAFEQFRQATLLSPKLLHRVIAERAWPTFIRGRYDTAVFEAFKEVEVAVRAAANSING